MLKAESGYELIFFGERSFVFGALFGNADSAGPQKSRIGELGFFGRHCGCHPFIRDPFFTLAVFPYTRSLMSGLRRKLRLSCRNFHPLPPRAAFLLFGLDGTAFLICQSQHLFKSSYLLFFLLSHDRQSFNLFPLFTEQLSPTPHLVQNSTIIFLKCPVFHLELSQLEALMVVRTV